MRFYSPKLAVFYALGAAFTYAVMGLLIKISETHVSSEMVVFFRQLISFFLITPLLLYQMKSFQSLKTTSFHFHLLRAFAGLSAMYCLVYALKYLSLVDALLLSYTRPLFIPIFAFFWFGTKWTKHIWWGLIIGFLGVLFILKPQQAVFNIATIVGLASGMFGAIAFISIRKLTKTELADKIFFYYIVLSLPIAAIPLLNNWQALTWTAFGFLFCIGVTGTFYEMFLTRAYRHAKAFKVGSLLYSTVIFGALFDCILGNSFLDYLSILGIVFIFVGSIITMKAPIPPKVSPKKK